METPVAPKRCDICLGKAQHHSICGGCAVVFAKSIGIGFKEQLGLDFLRMLRNCIKTDSLIGDIDVIYHSYKYDN